jgi:short-subunit dehydrogenase
MNVIITGASQGIGKAIAEKFAKNGYSLFLCARKEEPLAQLSKELSENYQGIKVRYKSCDVSEKLQVLDFAEWALVTSGGIDILVNNAGIFIQGSVHDEQEGVLEQLMRTNVYSAYYLTRHILPSMMARKSGHIFNICSIASLQAYKHGGSYSITKYALAGFSANLRDEMKPHGVKVTSVFPGAAYTASWDASGVSRDRIMKAGDIAEMVYATSNLSPQACVEEIVIRPQLGDL